LGQHRALADMDGDPNRAHSRWGQSIWREKGKRQPARTDKEEGKSRGQTERDEGRNQRGKRQTDILVPSSHTPIFLHTCGQGSIQKEVSKRKQAGTPWWMWREGLPERGLVEVGLCTPKGLESERQRERERVRESARERARERAPTWPGPSWSFPRESGGRRAHRPLGPRQCSLRDL